MKRITAKMARNFIAAIHSTREENKMSKRKPKHNAKVFLHPTATHSPGSVKRIEQASGRRAVLIDGVPVLVAAKDASKYLSTSP